MYVSHFYWVGDFSIALCDDYAAAYSICRAKNSLLAVCLWASSLPSCDHGAAFAAVLCSMCIICCCFFRCSGKSVLLAQNTIRVQSEIGDVCCTELFPCRVIHVSNHPTLWIWIWVYTGVPLLSYVNMSQTRSSSAPKHAD